MSQQGWDHLLDDDEKIIWQGRPDTAVVFKAKHIFTTIFGLFFAGFALFWMVMASRSAGVMWMFGMIHFTAGVSIIVGPIFGPPYKRRHTWYTLTSKRAFIATDMPVIGRKLKSYPITQNTPIYMEESGALTSIHFATRTVRTKNGSTTKQIGFERIEGSTEVMQLIRKVQQGTA